MGAYVQVIAWQSIILQYNGLRQTADPGHLSQKIMHSKTRMHYFFHLNSGIKAPFIPIF
ncbi:hypothetical protein FD12_GL002595 [Lentilactobacillus rapi DSM 19907 = JCM 15042]|uniref:Uncharacterized protein n=1 Tax=Lentilactobacillus rapi DSM 19907 = JCM 15042 TaxID=1423795 RepID=A0ABR5PCX8_9LACO|nr:hypothetical protein FD12_GL002595 [Lentilactobacillus rapi DSM 19907 = JCM 15042]